MGKKAIIFGASGLVGGELLDLLLKHENIEHVLSVGRKKLNVTHQKLEQLVADFSSINHHTEALNGDVLFCCLGTTIKKAGTREKFREVDLDYPVKLIGIAETNDINQFVVISSIGAAASSSNFYLQTKGMMELSLIKSTIPHKTILRPSLIMGSRQESRFGESVGIALMKGIGWLLIGKLRKYRGIKATSIAQAMLQIALDSNPPALVESDEIKHIVTHAFKRN
jgi:uncharacterized protein YbjT (DUF2867 family)